MTFPTNIRKEHLVLAIKKIDDEAFPSNADSQYYSVLFNEKFYPPKVVVSYANYFANGIILDRRSFEGGLDTPCFKLLEREGFKIVTKSKFVSMANVRIYEVKSSANSNYEILKSRDGLHFFWNEAKFVYNEIGDYIFVVNRTAKEALFTKISEKGISARHNSTKDITHFNNNHNSYDVKGQWESFLRFDIIQKIAIPDGWNWQTQLGSGEVYDIWKEGLAGQTYRNEKIEDLQKIFTSGEPFELLEECRKRLGVTENDGYFINNLEEILEWDECKRLMGDEEFCLEKARVIFNQVLDYTIPAAEYEVIFKGFKETKKSYHEFIEEFDHQSPQYPIALLIGKLIAYLDTNGANKHIWNEYEDKRTFAKAGIYQNMWVKNLVRFKMEGNNIDSLSSGIRNAFAYFNNPLEAFTIISDEHKSQIAEKILGKGYSEDSFNTDLLKYFQQYGIPVKNEENRTRLYSRILYHPTVEKIWKDSVRGLVAIDSNTNNWIESAIDLLKQREQIVLWWSKTPTGTNQTLAKLRKRLKTEGSFEFYLIVNGLVRYRAVIHDFAMANDYKSKNWNKNGSIGYYEQEFGDYKSDTQTASIVFLVDMLEKLRQPFDVEKFQWYGDYTAPRRDNLQPFQEVIIDDQVNVVPAEIEIPVAMNFKFSNEYRQVLTAIKTKPLILLAGISGTGKSRLVRTLAYKTCSNPELRTGNKPGNFELIQVKPNWHDSMDLLGYPSRISQKLEFIATDFLRFIVKAWQYPEVPFFLCLDEMNLAPVEQYFAEFLSVIETRRFHENDMSSDPFISKENIKIYSEEDGGFWEKLGINIAPNLKQQFLSEGLTLPSNLVVMGTVNMDETTHSFSRKVLDRAMTIEMNKVDLDHALEAKSKDWEYEDITISKKYILGNMTEGHEAYILFEEGEAVIKKLKEINEVLEGSPFKIAYRVRDEIMLYVYHNSLLDEKPADWLNKAMDEAISMKILSRIEGDENRTKRVLSGLKEILPAATYHDTSKKLDQMLGKLDYGYTSYWD